MQLHPVKCVLTHSFMFITIEGQTYRMQKGQVVNIDLKEGIMVHDGNKVLVSSNQYIVVLK